MGMGKSGPRRGAGKKIGLLGGTFDPIHIGHLRSAQEVLEAFNLNQVIFIPSAIPPHKPDYATIAARHRLQMVKLAVADNPSFTVSDVEIRREGRSYTVETISHFLKNTQEAGQLFYIIGADAFYEIETWKDYAQLFALCDFVVVSRPHFEPQRAPVLKSERFRKEAGEDHCYRHPSGHLLYLLRVTPIGISSTGIRNAIKEGRAITYLVPKEVEAYIEQRRLYRK